jgi:polyphosphate kinase 2 (PPK2 family)
MGFCTPDETEELLRAAPELEDMLVRSGIRLFKLFLTVGKEEQARRLAKRGTNPLKRWKLTPLDAAAQERWEAYSQAEQVSFERTSTQTAPWVRVDANDKRVATLNVIRHLLSDLDYPEKDRELLALDPSVVTRVAQREEDG